MTNVKTHYKTYNDKLLIIVISFKHWCYYLNGSQHFIKVFINYNNLWYFMSKTKLNDHQSWWFIMFVLYDFIIAHWSDTHNPADGPSYQPNYEQGQEEVDYLSTLQQKFYNLSVEALYLPEAWQQVTLNTYGPHLACISVLQYLQLKEEGKIKVKAEKWLTNSESSQIDIMRMQRKKCRSANFSLRMQKGPREGLLKILKGHRDLQRFVSKAGKDNLKDFRSDLKSSESLLKSFEDASEGKVKSKALSENFNEDQFEAEWVWLGFKRVQQRLSQHILHNYA